MTAYRDGDHARARPDAPAAPAETTLRSFRRALLLLLVIGLIGTALELVLMEHLEDWWQRIPLVLIGAALGVLLWHAVARTRASVYALRILMAIFVASAAAGMVLHAKGNREFALETKPGIAGQEIVAEMLTGAFPALAPGTMALLGLIGLLFTWRHPALASGE
ncbi:MAG TPA: hypothetical protein VFT04_13185 [Gemmatimonadales bacterium]|nr:hypothetical protein [Gemmatimonadales bacterium]